MNPTIIIDTREQTPLTFANQPTETGTLYSGDYSVKGMEETFAIERKTIANLVGSFTSGRDRFMNELHRLRGYRFRRIFILGTRSEVETGLYRSRAKRTAFSNNLPSSGRSHEEAGAFGHLGQALGSFFFTFVVCGRAWRSC